MNPTEAKGREQRAKGKNSMPVLYALCSLLYAGQ